MRVTGLNAEYEPIKEFNPINLQWRRRYYEFGSFEMQLVASDYDPNVKFVIHGDSSEIAIVNKWNYKKTAIGEFVTLSGYFYDFMFNRRGATNINGEFAQTRKVDIFVKDNIKLVTQTFKLPVTSDWDVSHYNYTITTTSISIIEEIGSWAQELLKGYELAYKTRYLPDTKEISFEIYKGLDRTTKQTTNKKIEFSSANKNIYDLDISVDDSNYKNQYMITKLAGTGTTVADMPAIVFASIPEDLTGIPKYNKNVLFEEPISNEISTKQELDTYIKQWGILQLLNQTVVENYDFKLDTTDLKYREDFDIGDKVDIKIDEVGVQSSARIVGIDEIYKNNNKELKLTLGTLRVKNRPQIRRY